MERSDRSFSPDRDLHKKGGRSYKEARRERHRQRCQPCEAYGHHSNDSWYNVPPVPTGRERLYSAAKAVVVSVVFFLQELRSVIGSWISEKLQR